MLVGPLQMVEPFRDRMQERLEHQRAGGVGGGPTDITLLHDPNHNDTADKHNK